MINKAKKKKEQLAGINNSIDPEVFAHHRPMLVTIDCRLLFATQNVATVLGRNTIA